MSNFSTTNEFLIWFKENYPRDHQLLDDILERVGNILKHIKIRDGEIIEQPIRIVVGNSPSDPTQLTIGMDTYGTMFIGIMAKVILDSLSSEFEGLLDGEIGNRVIEKKVKEILSKNDLLNQKICSGCNTKNSSTAKYCNGCGNLL